MNGDGLVDIVAGQYSSPYISVTSPQVYLNNGSGWALDTSWVFPSISPNIFNPTYGTYLADVNGDGLADILQAYETYGNTIIKGTYLNQGNGTFVQDTGYASPLMLFGEALGIGLVDTGVRVMDVNGDGLRI